MTKRHSFDVTRRDALRLGALSAAGLGMTGALARRAAAFAPRAMGSDKLLFVFVRGGWDALNVAIPYGDNQYNNTNRRFVYIPPAQAKTIETINNVPNTYCKMHPALGDTQTKAGLGLMLSDKKLVFLHRVGNQERSGSHFTDMQYMETGVSICNPPPSNVVDPEEGWVTRLGQRLLPPGFQGASISTDLQQLFQTRDRARVMSHIPRLREFPADVKPFYTLASDKPALDAKYKGADPSNTSFGYGLRGDYATLPHSEHDLDPLGRGAGKETMDSELAVSALTTPYAPGSYMGIQAKYPFGKAMNDPFYPDPGTEGLPDGGWVRGFFAQLRDAIWLLRHTSVRVAGVEIGGVDTHSNQGAVTGQLADRLKVIGYGLRSVYIDSRADGALWPNLTTLVMSEFARTSKDNDSMGTDHGGAGVALAMGNHVKLNNGSMIYNCDSGTWPDNTMFSAGDSDYGCNPNPQPPKTYVKHLTDIRSVFATILDKRFGANNADIDAIMPGASGLTRLDFLS